MIKYLFGLMVSLALFAVSAQAQVPDDILLLPVAGVYTINVQAPSDADVDQVCIYRVDVDPAALFTCVPATPDAVIPISITVEVTPNDDAEIRATALDVVGNESAFSPNAAIADFTAPGAPVIVP